MKKINYYLILLIVFALPSYLIRFDIFGIPTTLLEILIYLSAILSLCQILNTKYQIQKDFKKIIIPIILFITGGIIGIFVAPDRMTALGQFKAYIFDPILFFIVLVLNIRSEKETKNLLYAFFLSGIYVGAYSLWQYFSGSIAEDGRVVGIFGYSPNYTAFYLAPLFIIGLYLTYIDRKNNLFYSLLKILLLIIVVWGIVLTGSRGAILAIVGSIAFGSIIKYLFYLRNNIQKTIYILVLVVLVIAAGYFLIKPDFSVPGTDAGRIGSSNNIRWEIYKTTLNHIIPVNYHWLWGLGLGNFQNYFTEISASWINYPEYIAPKALAAHNLVLQSWLNVGIIGLIGFIWILINFFKSVLFKNPLSYALFVAMIAIMIQGAVDTPYWKNDLAVMFWMMVFISVFIYDDKNTPSKI